MAELLIRTMDSADIARELADIELKVPGIREAYESADNHGDSCWQAAVDWHPLADRYEQYRWLAQ